jgi:AcrR family transcriptional regulator
MNTNTPAPSGETTATPEAGQTGGQRAPWAKNRILETANELFYGDGIRTVGVDRLISESSVTKATFYKHYGSKDRLIVQYVKYRDKTARDAANAIIDGHTDPEKALRQLMDQVSEEIARPGFRGSAFLNAAAEYPDPTHPVRLIVTEHRDWFTDMLTGLLGEMGHPMPGDAADELMLAVDGATGGGYAGDPVAATTALGRVVERVLGETHK